MLENVNVRDLERFATEIRMATLREFEVRGFGHLGGSMSIADVLAVLYGAVMNIDPANPQKPDRDYLVLSKGHAGPALYATLALKGYFPVEKLDTLNQNGTNFPSHCDRLKTTGIDMTTGSLGQGAASAAGIALANKVAGRDNYTYVIVGDGESNEGQVWETIMFAANQHLDHFVMLVDYNRQQLDGTTEEISGLNRFEEKFSSFGWDVQSIDGNDVQQVYDALQAVRRANGKPKAIVLNTIKGKGVPMYEGTSNNHHIEVKPEVMREAIELLRASL